MVFAYKGIVPKIDPSAYLAPGCTVVGDVHVGADSSLWFGVIVRGDVNFIRIGQRTNIQDGSVVHVTLDTHPTIVGDDVSVGHHVTLHGCTVKDKCLVGIGSRILDGAVIGESSLVAAGSLVPPGLVVPPRSLVMGAPAKVKRPLTEQECTEMHTIAERYVRYQGEYRTDVIGID